MRNARRAAPALVLLLLIAAAGCGAKKSVVGKWSGTASIPGQAGVGGSTAAVYEFKADGTETIGLTVPTPIGKAAITTVGTYAVKDDTLTQTFTSAALNGKTIPVPPASSAPLQSKFKLNGDTLTLSPVNNPTQIVLTRVKS